MIPPKTAIFLDLKGKSVFITGGGSGIGAALSEGFLAQGASVAFVQRSDATAFCAEMVEKYGQTPLFIPCDITDIGALERAIDEAAEVHGAIQVLVNNAANDERHVVGEVREDFWDWSQAINLKAYFFACQAVAKGMAGTGGKIVNFSSISYMMGNAGYASYAAANAGITGLTYSLARELGPRNIRVNALAPGWVLTEKQLDKWATPEALATHLERQCLKKHLVAQDIVDATLFLSSEASRMMTGQVMAVDGGVVHVG